MRKLSILVTAVLLSACAGPDGPNFQQIETQADQSAVIVSDASVMQCLATVWSDTAPYWSVQHGPTGKGLVVNWGSTSTTVAKAISIDEHTATVYTMSVGGFARYFDAAKQCGEPHE